MRKGLVKLARKFLAGMPRFLNSANFLFRSSTRLIRYYVLPYICFPSLVEPKCWLAEVMFFPSSTPTEAFQHSRHFRVRFFPKTLPRAAREVWGPDCDHSLWYKMVHWHLYTASACTHLPSIVLGWDMNSLGFMVNLFPSTNSTTFSPHTGGTLRPCPWLEPAMETADLPPPPLPVLELLPLLRLLLGRSWGTCLSLSAWEWVREAEEEECSTPTECASPVGWSPGLAVWVAVGWWAWWWPCGSGLLEGEEWALPLGLSFVTLRLWLVRGILRHGWASRTHH